MVKGILLDLDDTLYEYESAHRAALQMALNKISKRTGVDLEEVREVFDLAKRKLKAILPSVASGHSRILYFQLMYEALGIAALPHALHDSEYYWSNFVKSMELTPDSLRFLEKNKGVPICLVTDLTAEIQYQKIRCLGLDRYIHHIVTSEEAGIEKPHPFMFQLGLNKLCLGTDDVIMVGDSFKKDIIGASLLGIRSYWLNRDGGSSVVLPAGCQEICSLDEVLL